MHTLIILNNIIKVIYGISIVHHFYVEYIEVLSVILNSDVLMANCV